MFTGLIEHLGRIATLEKTDSGARLRVDAGPLAASLAISSSIAVNGCCLTVVELDGSTFTADLSGETLRRTSLGEMKPGASVNLERPLAAGQELGGHFVQGHVDGVGRVTRLVAEGANWWFGVRVPANLAHYVVMKGSVALDGISLTVAGISDDHRGRHGDCVVETAIIPYTYSHTNLHSLASGDAVNVETDILAKYVERLLNSRNASAPASQLTVQSLTEQGF
jgi:riboflavin synthase